MKIVRGNGSSRDRAELRFKAETKLGREAKGIGYLGDRAASEGAQQGGPKSTKRGRQ